MNHVASIKFNIENIIVLCFTPSIALSAFFSITNNWSACADISPHASHEYKMEGRRQAYITLSLNGKGVSLLMFNHA